VLIDAGFGTGLTRPLEGRAASFAEAMNATGLPIVSVDLPSGMPAGGATPERGQVLVRARLTLTFQCPKPVL
ncbi:MAG: NAD(P)H-hydrate epimerase, partial [Flavobacteriales bacterium]|nr:NAD(P)H-hydrate epimerase [Flavobacteriales bacterium]